VNEFLLVGIPAVLTLVGTIYVAYSSRRNADLANQIEGVKAQALSKAETIKVSTEAETKRTDALLDTQMTFIRELQTENRAQRQEMLATDKIHREEMLQVRQEVTEISKLMNACVEARQAQEKTVQAQGETIHTQGKTITKLSAEVLELKGRLTDMQHPA
jgi:hypothetical protein